MKNKQIKMTTDESMEDRLRRMEEESEVEMLRRRVTELEAKLTAADQNTPKYITPQTLEDELKKVSSHVVLPKGKYIVKCDIIIDEAGMLEIEPGAELYFAQDAGIVAYGTLRAVGTEQDKILFTALRDIWRNVAFAGGVASDSVLEHCVIRHGTGRKKIPANKLFKAYETQYRHGGAVLIVSANPVVKHCFIEGNHADHGGGGICLSNSSPDLDSNLISGNRANFGGGIYLYKSSPHLDCNTISRNQADYGGGIYIYESYPRLKGNTIAGNKPDNIGRV